MNPVLEVLLHIFYVVYIYLASAYYVLKQIYFPRVNPSLPSCKGMVALITGGGQGIGFETASKLLSKNMTVIFVGLEEDLKGINTLRSIYPSQVHFVMCDLSNLKNVKKVAKKFDQLGLPLHLLILNAGIMFGPHRTVDGFESHFVINYLSQFFLTHSLLPALKKSSTIEKPSRIVTLGSCLHFCGSINFDDLQGRQFYDRHAAYCQSKLAMVMFAQSLARKLKNGNCSIIANSVHPAVVFSGLLKYSLIDKLPWIGNLLLETPEGGCQNVLYAAVDQTVTKGGYYFDNGAAVTPSREASCIRSQDKLWDVSCNLLQIENFGFI